MTSDKPDAGLVWEKMWVGRPSDTHFSAGGTSPLARADDTNRLDTHATLGDRLKEDEENSPDSLNVAKGIALGVLLTIAAFKAAPRVKTWWRERRTKKILNVDAPESADEDNTVDEATLALAEFASQVDVALDEQRRRMSSAEAQRRILEILLAAAVIADNMRTLSIAQLEDGASEVLHTALEKLSVPQVTDSLNRMLESESTLLDEDASAILMARFGGGRAVDGQYIPLQNNKIREALRLPEVA